MMGQNRCMLLHLTPHPPGPVSLPMFGIHLISLKETFSKLHKLARVKSEVGISRCWFNLKFGVNYISSKYFTVLISHL